MNIFSISIVYEMAHKSVIKNKLKWNENRAVQKWRSLGKLMNTEHNFPDTLLNKNHQNSSLSETWNLSLSFPSPDNASTWFPSFFAPLSRNARLIRQGCGKRKENEGVTRDQFYCWDFYWDFAILEIEDFAGWKLGNNWIFLGSGVFRNFVTVWRVGIHAKFSSNLMEIPFKEKTIKKYGFLKRGGSKNNSMKFCWIFLRMFLIGK